MTMRGRDISGANVQTVSLSIEEAMTLARTGLQRIGYEADEAQLIADNLVNSERMGYPALGIARVLTIAEHPRHKEPRRSIAIQHETAVSAVVDCGNHVGLYALQKVTEIAIDKARSQGFAVVGAHNSFLSGRNAYYLEMIAEAGYVGVHTACSQPVVAPFGGAAATFGTNPIAIGIPHEPHPVVLDMATSAANLGDLILADRLGRDLPEDVAIDAEGNPTRNPAMALAGSVLPFGGHRGSGMAFIIQALGLLGGAALTGGNVQDFGFLFILFDPELLMRREELQRQLDELIARVKSTPRRPGFDEIRLPSERAYAERQRCRTVTLPATICDQLLAL